MGLYFVVKDGFTRPTGERIPIGKAITIDLRSEAEAGLKDGFLSKDREVAKRLLADKKKAAEEARRNAYGIAKQKIRDPEMNEDEAAAVTELSRMLALPKHGAKAMFFRYHREGATVQETLFEIRKAHNALTDEEVLGVFGEEEGLSDAEIAELQADIYRWRDETRAPMVDVLEMTRESWERGVEPSQVMAEFKRLREEGGLATADAKRKAVEAVAEIAATVAAEAEAEADPPPALEPGLKVEITGGALEGRIGAVEKLLSNGTLRVVVDGDDKKYRIVSVGDVEVQ